MLGLLCQAICPSIIERLFAYPAMLDDFYGDITPINSYNLQKSLGVVSTAGR